MRVSSPINQRDRSGGLGQKTEQGAGDRLGTFHLDPVAGAVDIYLAAQVGYEVVHQIAPAAAAAERQDRILLAGDEQCWPLDLGRPNKDVRLALCA